ncbi:MAG: MarR family winged helix-turn-helix transcriptional regulator [Thalassovita sp.]
MSFTKDTSAGYLLNTLARLFARELQTAIKPLGLSTGVFPALLALWERDGRTQKELVAELGIEQATMANTLVRMERDKLVIRRGDETDGRVQRVWLTDRAKMLKDPAIHAAEAVNARALAGLPHADQERFLRMMQQVLRVMSEG